MPDQKPTLLATDLEGIFLPEIWIAVAEQTGIAKLRLTTRDISDYDELMQMRLGILAQHQVTIRDIQAVIAEMDILPGAEEFMKWARARLPMIIITDSYYEMVAPFLPKLDYATIFAHSLITSSSGELTGYRLRMADNKRKSLEAFRALGFRTIAVGDSFNDIGMLTAADKGILFQPSQTVRDQHPDILVATTYGELQDQIQSYLDK